MCTSTFPSMYLLLIGRFKKYVDFMFYFIQTELLLGNSYGEFVMSSYLHSSPLNLLGENQILRSVGAGIHTLKLLLWWTCDLFFKLSCARRLVTMAIFRVCARGERWKWVYGIRVLNVLPFEDIWWSPWGFVLGFGVFVCCWCDKHHN